MATRIRPARPADIPALSKLLLFATDGVVEAVYRGLVPGKATHEIVERRFRRLGTTGSYEACWVVVDRDDQVIGKLHAYPMDALADDPPDDFIPEERLAVVAPFDHLDPVAAGSYYINIVAVSPEFQGQGIGTRLLELAREQALERGLTTLSIAVFEENRDALRLYQRMGFREVARHLSVRHPLIRHGGDLLMLLRPAPAPR